jgi:hypothetical protein
MNTKLILIIFIIIYIFYITIFNGYIAFTPTIPIYPNNSKEIVLLKKIIKSRTQDDVNFFYLTNKSVSSAFLPYVNESDYQLKKICHNYIILAFKYIINRPRPNQIDLSIIPINTDTSRTPSYPAGHSYQAYLLYKKLSKKYPEKKELLRKIALRCDDCRVKAGLHYPSDGEFSRKIVDLFVK